MSSPGGTVYMLKKGTGKLGYEGVFEPHKGRKGFHAKLRLDPHSKDQTTLPGAACQTPEEAALRLARFVANPFPIFKKERAARGEGERSKKKVHRLLVSPPHGTS